MVASLLGTCIALVPAYVALVLSSDSGAAGTGAAAASSGPHVGGATDRQARITFHLTGGALGLRLLRDAPRAALAVRGRGLTLVCGHRGPAGLALLRRTLRWPAGSRTARVALPPQVLASMEFCSLADRGRAVARVVFA